MLIAHLVACAFMCGVIWIIQILHYPAFRDIEDAKFRAFHRGHSGRISFIVAPVMIGELASGTWLLYKDAQNVWLIANFVLLLATWISTFALSVPIHNSLEKAKDIKKIEKLIQTNWPRTLAWSARLLILAVYLGVVRG